MLNTFMAHADETLQSMVANAIASVSLRDRKLAGLTLAGVYGAKAHPELPTHLDAVQRHLGRALGFDVHELIQLTTSFPLYRPFLSSERSSAVVAAMRGGGRMAPSSLVAIHADKCRRARNLVFCVDCVGEDTMRHGHSWWRRTHQAAGVCVCPRHGCGLSVSQFGRQGDWQLDWPQAHKARETFRFAEVPDVLAFLAREVSLLLRSDIQPVGQSALRAAYRELLSASGFLHAGRLKRSEFLHGFADSMGRGNLGRLGLGFDCDSFYSWPAKVAIVSETYFPPQKHILACRFLGTDVRTMLDLAASSIPRPKAIRGRIRISEFELRALWDDSSLSFNEVVRRTGANYHTVRGWASRLGLRFPRRPEHSAKSDFATRRAENRRHYLRGGSGSPGFRRCRRWLQRNDNAWLGRNARAASKRVSARRVDWHARDREFSADVAAAVRSIRGVRPFRRVTRMAVGDALGARSHIYGVRSLLPRFNAEIEANVENWETYALRRIASVRAEHRVARWRVRELAGISGPLLSVPSVVRALNRIPRQCN